MPPDRLTCVSAAPAEFNQHPDAGRPVCSSRHPPAPRSCLLLHFVLVGVSEKRENERETDQNPAASPPRACSRACSPPVPRRPSPKASAVVQPDEGGRWRECRWAPLFPSEATVEAQAALVQLSVDVLAPGSSNQLQSSQITVFPRMKSPSLIPELQSLQLLWLRVELGPPVHVTGTSRCAGSDSRDPRQPFLRGVAIIFQAAFCTHGTFWTW